jgi:hypothetical protein
MTNLETFRMTIGGKPVDALSGRTFESQNPYTGTSWAVVPDTGSGCGPARRPWRSASCPDHRPPAPTIGMDPLTCPCPQSAL